MNRIICRTAIYLDIMRKSFRGLSIYNMNVIINILSGFIVVVVQIAVWTALYENGQKQATSLESAITYTVLNVLLIRKCFVYVAADISDSIYSGDIENDFIRPISVKGMAAMRSIGRNVFNLYSSSLPIMVVLIIFYRIKGPLNIVSLISAIITAIFGQIIFWLFDCILGYTAFWLKANWYVAYIEATIMALFGGTAIPIWFYPKWLQDICFCLPFKYVGYQSIYIYLNGNGLVDFFKTVSLQILWILLLLIFEKIIWSRAIKQTEIFGG